MKYMRQSATTFWWNALRWIYSICSSLRRWPESFQAFRAWNKEQAWLLFLHTNAYGSSERNIKMRSRRTGNCRGGWCGAEQKQTGDETATQNHMLKVLMKRSVEKTQMKLIWGMVLHICCSPRLRGRTAGTVMDGRTRRGLTQGAALNSHTSNTPTLTVDVLPAAHTRTGTHTHTRTYTRTQTNSGMRYAYPYTTNKYTLTYTHTHTEEWRMYPLCRWESRHKEKTNHTHTHTQRHTHPYVNTSTS